MTVGLFDSVYAETILSLLGYFSDGADVKIVGDRDMFGAPYNVFIINRMLPKKFAGVSLRCDVAVVDSDDSRILGQITRTGSPVVTYGFNSKASVTVSGVSADEPPFGLKVAFCLRRSVRRPDGDLVLQQEFMVDTGGVPFKRGAIKDISEPSFVARCLLPAVSAAIITGRKTRSENN